MVVETWDASFGRVFEVEGLAGLERCLGTKGFWSCVGRVGTRGSGKGPAEQLLVLRPWEGF